MHDEKYIQASEINAFVYCPMQWYYRFVLNINIYDDNMKIGKILHENHWLNTFQRKERFFISHNLKLKGVVDYLVDEEGKKIPMEIKKGKYHDHKEYDKMQLLTYIKLLEDFYNFKYTYGYILYIQSRKKVKLEVDKKDRSLWYSYLRSIRSHKKFNTKPISPNNKLICYNCSLKTICEV